MREKSIWHNYKERIAWTDSLPECSIYELARQKAVRYPNKIAIEFEGKKTTYKKLFEQIDATASALIANGVKKGDCISIVSINTPQVVIMIYAANRIGAVVNMIHPLLSPTEIKKFIQDTKSTTVLILDQIYQKIKDIKWDNELNPTIILTRIVDALPIFIKPIFSLKVKTKIALNQAHKAIYWNTYIGKKNTDVYLPEDDGRANDLAMIMYSGGTSGTPKGVMLSNFNINSYAIAAYETLKSTNPIGKKSLAVLPLFHGFGFGSSIHVNLILGVTIFLVPKFDFNRSIKLTFKKKINYITAVPAFYEAMIRSPYFENRDLSFIESLFCGGDKLQMKLREKLIYQLKKGNSDSAFFEGYGQTECVAGCIVTPYFATNSKSVGIALPDVKTKIVKPGTFEEVPDGTDGELCISSPMVMLGYYNNKDETEKTLRVHPDGNKWLHTGDMLSRDENGFFYFKQRISRMIISAGYNIYVEQMEKIIAECDEVLECCVVGIDDKVLGKKIKAYIVSANKEANVEDIKRIVSEKCKNNLAEYSQPHEICIIDTLPMTHLGKVNYKKLENKN